MKKVFLSSKYVLLLALLGVPFLVCGLNEQSPFEMIKMVVASILTLIAGVLFLLSHINSVQIKFKWNHTLSFLFVILSVTFLSFLFSNNQFNSFWGNNNIPSDSLLTTMMYFLFCFIATQVIEKESDLKKFNLVLIASAFLLAVYGVIQHFGYDPVDWWGYRQMHLNAYGTIGQSVGFASILGTLLPLAIVYYLGAENINIKRLLLFIIFIILMGIMYSGSRAPMAISLGIVLVLSFIFWYKNKTKSGLKIIGWLILTMALSQAVYYGEPSKNALTHKLKPQIISSGLQERIQVWEDAIRIWQKYPILGTGPEHFALELKLVNTKDFNTNQNWGLYWHKAHNHILHFLATIGVVGLLAHLAFAFFILYSFVQLIRKPQFASLDWLRLGFLFGFGFLFIGNIVAFNFVLTQLYMVLLPTLYSISFFSDAKVMTLATPRFLNVLNIVLACLLFSLFGYEIYRYWSADRYFSLSRRALEAERNMTLAIEHIDKAIATKETDCRFYLRKSSLITSLIKFQVKANPGLNPEQALRELDALTMLGVNCDAKNPESWFYRARLFSDLFESRIEPSIDRAEKSFIEGAKFSPANPVFPFNQGLLYMLNGQWVAFINRMMDTIELKPDYISAYNRLFEYYYRDKNQAKIDELTQKIANTSYISGEALLELGQLIQVVRKNGDTRNADILLRVYTKVEDSFKLFREP